VLAGVTIGVTGAAAIHARQAKTPPGSVIAEPGIEQKAINQDLGVIAAGDSFRTTLTSFGFLSKRLTEPGRFRYALELCWQGAPGCFMAAPARHIIPPAQNRHWPRRTRRCLKTASSFKTVGGHSSTRDSG
jgi:hypothetical protein